LAVAETPYIEDFDQYTLLVDIKKQLASQAESIEKIHRFSQHVSLDHISLDDVPLTVLHDKARTERSKIRTRVNGVLMFSLIGFVALGALMYKFSEQLTGINYSMVELGVALSEANSIPTVSEPARVDIDPNPLSNLDGLALIDALNWASTLDTQYAYEASPLDERQTNNIQELVERLSQSDYSGELAVNIQFGNFCLTTGGPTSEQWVLAADTAPIGACVFYEDVYEERDAESFLSIPFIQFEESSLSVVSGEIDVNVNVTGFAEPSVPYPSVDSIRTAKEWNAIAARNNRLTLQVGVN